MALGTITVQAASVIQTNDQRYQYFDGLLSVSAFGDTYPVGGFPFDSVLAAALMATGTLKWAQVWSDAGSGYLYQRIAATGRLMVLQLPPNGSLTTAAPLQQLGSNANSMSGVFLDTIRFRACYLRNS